MKEQVYVMLVPCAVSAFQLWTLHDNSLEKSKLNEAENMVTCLYVNLCWGIQGTGLFINCIGGRQTDPTILVIVMCKNILNLLLVLCVCLRHIYALLFLYLYLLYPYSKKYDISRGGNNVVAHNIQSLPWEFS
ncbi:hypothetical protein SCA6_013834 [Theobroma cacao]